MKRLTDADQERPQAGKATKPLIKSMKKTPSQNNKDASGKGSVDQIPKPKIIQFLNIGDNSIHIDSQVDVDEPLFAPEPHVIQFTNYEPQQTKEQTLRLRNKDKVARCVRIIPPDSKLFTVTPAKKSAVSVTAKNNKGAASEDIDNLSSKVAPGMEITYIVKFSPEAKSDYAYDLMVITEREKFIVPIRARGYRAKLDFPNTVDFSLVPVKFDNEKPVMIRNVGEKTTKWQIKTPASFTVSKSEGILELGQVEQLVFHFKPSEARLYSEELLLTYDQFEQRVQISGEAHNDNVYLSKGHVTADPTSITLFSHQYFKIVNKSAVPIEFSWRAFATEMEENEKKDRLCKQLALEEGDELADIEHAFANGRGLSDDEGSLDSDDSYNQNELEAKNERRRQKALSTLQRKYTAIRKAVTEDKMLFQDEIFQCEPLEGKIWPNTEMTCCVTFRPQGPYQYACTAFCNTTCSQDRLALNLSGQGRGPQAQLSITEMDIGDVFVTSEKRFEVGIENTGEIDCHWKLIPYETPFGSKFTYSKTEGILGVKENLRDLLQVRFLSDILGEFSETFRFALEGSSEMLTLTFRGHVVAPTFKFSDEIIDFGRVSYKFPVTKTVCLTNTSEVDINYAIRVPGDGRSLQQEFIIDGEKGRLQKGSHSEIKIVFVPSYQQTYDMVLVVDLEGVGQDMLAVPIKADCKVPVVRVNPNDVINYETCFLRHRRTKEIEIINDDDLKAKFEILGQDDQSKRVAGYEADLQTGIIEPHTTQKVQISLRTEILQNIHIPLYIKLDGYPIPTMLTIMAESKGPIVKVDRTDIDHGNIDVLKDNVQHIEIRNESEIDAEYTAFTKLKESVWKVVQRHGILAPGAQKTIDIICTPDEAQKFTDTLHIIVNNGVDLEVSLAAKGVGTTLYCKQDMKSIDFGTEYTHKMVPKQFFLENRGRKQMKITWVRQVKPQKKNDKEKADDAKKKQATNGTGAGDMSSTAVAVKEEKEEEKFIFSVVPETVVLNPKMGIMVEFRANSTQIGKMSEPWQCQVQTGSDRKPKPIWNSTVFGNFITPTLTFNYTKLDFKYCWEKGVPSLPITKDLQIKNTGPLATTIHLKIDPPFSCPVEKLMLEKEQSDQVKIDFDPGMKQDRVSDHINGKMMISHEGHPHKENVLLQGEVCFPNLKIEPPKIDFGCILNDTSKKKYLVLSNVSEMPVAYEWSFLEDVPIVDEAEELAQGEKKKKRKKMKRLPINEVFDILPVSGILQPGTTENVEFTFYAGSGITYNGTAVCSCDGGPDYEVPIHGDSNLVTYRLSTNELDFGEVAYNESSTKEFYIENIGKVPFEFNINLGTVSRPGVIECSVMSGKVIAGEKFKVTIRFFAGVPDNIHEMFLVECSHFPAERFTVKAVGIYPGCLLSFPRSDEEEFGSDFEKIKHLLNTKKIDYSALFHGADALRVMPPPPAKFIDKEKAIIREKETFIMDVEAEVDRQMLCNKIINLVQTQLEENKAKASGGNPDLPDTPRSQDARADRRKPKRSEQDKMNATSGEGTMTGSITNQIKVGGSSISLDGINITNYLCDFGNVVVGGGKKKSFRMTNTGKIAINFNFDKKLLGQAGIAIDPDKVQKVNPNQSVFFTVSLTTRKLSKYGRVCYRIPIDIKQGPTYTIDFVANLTIPELSMSTDLVDFDRVLINTRKTVKIRFENLREVVCIWNYINPNPANAAAAAGDKKKEVENFSVFPLTGTLLPGQRQTIDVMFIPNSDKSFQQKISFKCVDNLTKQFHLTVKGQGTNNLVELVPENLKLGPVLPYDASAISAFEIRNPMEHPIEIYSLDFDKQYTEEEEIIKRIDNFSTSGSNEPIFQSYRKAGGEFWPSIKQADEVKLKLEGLRGQLKKFEDQLNALVNEEGAISDYQKEKASREAAAASMDAEAAADAATKLPELKEPERDQEAISEERNRLTNLKGEIEAQLTDLEADNLEVKLPPALKEEKKLNVLLIGPPGCGKTVAANYMAQEHQRSIIRMDQLVDFWYKRNGALAEEATRFLEQREEELKEALAEQEKNKKKKFKKGEEPAEVVQDDYKKLPQELLKRMIVKRIEEEDCNAGAIFDNLVSEHFPEEKATVEMVCEASGVQNIQVTIFKPNMEKMESGDDEKGIDICTNYRYMRRKNAQGLRPNKQGTELKPAVEIKVKKSTTIKKSTGGAKGSLDAETQAAEEARQKAIQEKAKQDAEEAKTNMFKPCILDDEARSTYSAYVNDFIQFFSELILRQQSTPKKEGVEGEDNDEAAEGQAVDQQQDASADAQAEGADANGDQNLAENSIEMKEEPKVFGKRIVRECTIEYDLDFFCENVCQLVPSPEWPDPDKEPLPQPTIHSILKRPPNRNERAKITKFIICTAEVEKPTSAGGVDREQPPAEAEDAVEDNKPKMPALREDVTRWVLQPRETKKLYMKFFSTKIGAFTENLQFEIVGSYKTFTLPVTGACEFPTINNATRNLYLNQKKTRPTEKESIVSKCFIQSEGVFDFGPLLIKKDPEQRTDEVVAKMNGSFFQISNNGKYEVDATFTLRSTLPTEEGGPEGKSPFILEPAECHLSVDGDSSTCNLKVFAFPEEDKLYTDEVIVLLKDNPNPVIIPIQCLGAKPVVNASHDVVKFDRALIGKTLQKTLTLTNASPLPINWALKNVDKLSEEFEVSKTSGLLKPYREEPIEITFKSIKQQKFSESIVLEVFDNENLGIRQEDKTIILDAEGFNITLNEQMQLDQTLDFEAVRVGEPKELPIFLKNQGQYPIKFDFNIKKKAQEIFTIEPMVGKLLPNEEINIIVRFLSQKEIKLKTTKNTADINLNILEGEQNEKHQSIPILINVNAVFSKYQIAPLKNLNFGPMQYGETGTRTFEVRNEGLFEFKYAICDYNNEEEKNKIKEERKREAEERLTGAKEEEDPKAKGKKDPKAAAAPAKGAPKGGKGEPVPSADQIQVSQYAISPAIGSVAPGSSAVVTVTFNAQGAKFYDSTLAIDIANRDYGDRPDGIPFQLAAESSIPGINTEDLDQIFEEQTVIPSLDPKKNTQTIISSSLFSIEENVFWFGTLIAGKSPEGSNERFKIINPNKVACTIKFAVKPRTQSKSEGFAFTVAPEGLTIDPHKHKYVTVTFAPSEMKQYGGIFEAMVQSGDPNSKQGKMQFELRGEGTLPTLQVNEPEEKDPTDGYPLVRFPRTRVNKENIASIVLVNEGQVPATAKFDAITNENFEFLGSMNHTIMSKQQYHFDLKFAPKSVNQNKFLLTFQTQNNVYEQHKVMLVGEGYAEPVIFDDLPLGKEEELIIGDCVIGKAKAVEFTMVNTCPDKDLKFRWSAGAPDREEFTFYPTFGHLRAGSTKTIKVMVRGKETKKYEKIDFQVETSEIKQSESVWTDFDDTMKTMKMVRPSEFKKIQRDRELADLKRKEEAEAAAAAAGGKKIGKPPAKAAPSSATADDMVIDENEEPSVELVDVIPEPEHTTVEGSVHQQMLKTSCVIDRASYESSITRIDFKPTLMYATRNFKFTVKNTSLIGLEFNFKIANAINGVLDAGPYTIIPKQGTIAPGCDENYIVKFSPVEISSDFNRILSANVRHLSTEKEPLIIECNGIAERPIIHFELPLSTYRERKQKDMTALDANLKIIEFESLGTFVRNTNRFMAVNPTSQGYEFEWEEIVEDKGQKKKPLFKCVTPKGLILSGKKSEMVFEYTPDSVGEHESRWLFKIPSEKITQEFLVVGRVNEPNVLFELGKLKFGPLLLSGKQKETVRIINQEHIPFSFNFSTQSVKGSPDYGDSLKVAPMSGTVPAFGELPIEITFSPKYELTYNYNLICNLKRKARPLVLNVKGEGYQIHHQVLADSPARKCLSTDPTTLSFGEFFINEKRTKEVVLKNEGEFNFDFVWKRGAINKSVVVTPETGTVQKGSEITVQIAYLPQQESHLKNYKLQMSIISGPKYDFQLVGSARKPGVKLSQQTFDFGACFVTSQPAPIKKTLTITNVDSQAISVESNFEKKVHLDFPLVPGTVLMPGDDKFEIPITFTPRELRKYQETIKLNFNNGLYFVDVVVQGQGIPLNLELKDPDQAYTNLGIVSVGQEVIRTVSLINRSLKTVKFKVLPADKKEFAGCALTMTPIEAQTVVLKPKELHHVEIKFRPKERIKPFEHDIMLQVEGIEETTKMCTVSGVAHGIELRLMDEVAAFGSVVVDSRLTKYIQMSNFGDVKANFAWDKTAFGKHFTIEPAQGYINPNANLDLEVIFHPRQVDNDLRCKVSCQVQGGEPLTLNMMGKAIPQDTSETKEMMFNTVVRKDKVETIKIDNPEDREWAINPSISTSGDTGNFFKGSSTFIVPAKGSANYEVIYCPKSMTQKVKKADSEDMEDKYHQGNVFFPLPNGTALLYSLKGVATAPQSEGTITETVEAKKPKNFIVKVPSWSNKTAAFNASWEIEGETDPALFIRGAKTFYHSGVNEYEYKLNFLALHAGSYKFVVTFKEKETGEYCFYNFTVTVEESKEVQNLELVSEVRESCSQGIVIENPTADDIKINRTMFTVSNEYIEITPEEFVIKAQDAREFYVNFRPLIVSESQSDVILKNPTLGEFKYALQLKGIPNQSQRSLAFKCSLGQDQMQAFKFMHFMKKATAYAVKVERVEGNGACDFKADVATVPAPIAESFQGVELSINIRYEPITIGESRGVLKLTSPEGLEYTCMLYGRSSAPQPQGPIKCPGGAKPNAVDFKNPLNEKADFICTFDNPNFSLASKPAGLLDPGKSVQLQIKFEGKTDLPTTGRMLVTTKGLPPWIFYLQGE